MRTVEFSFDQGPDRYTRVVKKLSDVLFAFEEFNLRVSVLKTNPHMKNFYDKLQEIDKISRIVSDIITEFNLFQKSWLFLNGIFSRSSLSEQLNTEKKLFNNISTFYRATLKGLILTP